MVFVWTLSDVLGVGLALGVVLLALYVVARNLVRSWRWHRYLRDIRARRGQ